MALNTPHEYTNIGYGFSVACVACTVRLVIRVGCFYFWLRMLCSHAIVPFPNHSHDSFALLDTDGPARMPVFTLLSTTILLLRLRSAAALDNGVGQLPIMGWGTWNLFGCWGYNWTEVDVRQMADALVSSGMKKAGYTYINLDGGWLGGRDNVTGVPYPNPSMFPSGMPALVDYVHSLGLKFGIYRDRHRGLGYEVVDAQTYAKWKCDYVKNDGYGKSGCFLITTLGDVFILPTKNTSNATGNSTQSYSHGQTATEVYARFR